MTTIAETVRNQVESQVTRLRWALGITGALSVAFGILVLVWPEISLHTLVILFGAFALARGVVGLATAIAGNVGQGRGWLVLSSLAGIVVGVLVFLYTDMSALALLYVIGAYAIVLGFISFGAIFWLPLNNEDSILFALAGFVSVVFGVVMFVRPDDGALVLLGLIAAYALITGVSELVVAIGGKKLVERRLQVALSTQARQSGTPQPTH
jgi:uncharacterized membrane protein HdeD (DUF308 family)